MDTTNGGDRAVADAATTTATATAHSNIALAKYWGKRDAALNIPAVGSLSITLERLTTETTVQFADGLSDDEFWFEGLQQPLGRIGGVLALIRERARLSLCARVTSANDFPTGAGLASSASGFAALTVAAAAAAHLDLTGRELSVIARRGSASAARSIYGGFVELHAGSAADGLDSFAEPVLGAADWPLSVVIAITDPAPKSVSSTAGMMATRASSPFYSAWIESSAPLLDRMREAVLHHDFTTVGELAEHSCLALHSLMLTTKPALIYWNAATVSAMHAVRELRASGVQAYFTIDAGPQVKALCQPADAATVTASLSSVPGVREVRLSALGAAAQVVHTR